MHNPYAAIQAIALRRALAHNHAPRDASDRPTNAPSPQALRVAQARVAAAIVASLSFRSITSSRGDYPAIIGNMPTPFRTRRD